MAQQDSTVAGTAGGNIVYGLTDSGRFSDFGATMVQFALFAAIALSHQTTPTDMNVWFHPYVDITSHSPFDDQASAKYDARDVFGGMAGTIPHEQGRVVFQDDNGGPGQPDFIEWNTKEPVSISRLVISWQDDTPGNNWRNLAQFTIAGRRTAAEPWKVLWQENTPSSVGRYTMEKKIPAGQYQLFRAEFIRSAAKDILAVAPRICALEAYGHVVKP